MLGLGISFTPFGTGKNNFGHIPDAPESEYCGDWYDDETDTLCERCANFDEGDDHHAPCCCGSEFRPKGDE